MRDNIAKKIIIKGLVQGVGFRPFVYRLAHHYDLKGWVENRNDAVLILAEGKRDSIAAFESALQLENPKISVIQSLTSEPEGLSEPGKFSIRWSRDMNDQVTEISPDIAVCEDCLSDMQKQVHRIQYPFINCTNCGPRFSIIKGLPYDRIKTTMNVFEMCSECRIEYDDVMDRRFHAQPVACNKCGPTYSYVHNQSVDTNYSTILEKLSSIIEKGGSVLIKGIGGYFLVCDALNREAVKKLRAIKRRYGKPFAVMFNGLDTAESFVEINETEKAQLNSWRRPIVILKGKKELPKEVSNGFNTVGTLLPYLPLHYHLFEHISSPALVMTSGNFFEEPIIIDDHDTQRLFKDHVEGVVINNREIYNRVDDSVMMVVGNEPRLIRRSRGFVPESVFLTKSVDGIVAVGAELVNCFCVGKEQKAIMSQHIGDLKNLETLEFFEESLERFLDLFRVKPALVVHDLHPDYLSTRYAQQLDIQSLAVQHHHAHIVSCMAEHGLDKKVIGISMDGTGLGTDNHIWGSEFFVCDTRSFERISHFDYVPMPGGDLAVKEPWRMTLAYLYSLFGKNFDFRRFDFYENIPSQKANLVIEALEKSINVPLTCGAGRLFDAVSALLGVCLHNTFHAEAPMRLESILQEGVSAAYEVDFGEVIGFKNMFEQIFNDLSKREPVGVVAAKFHNTIINILVEGAVWIKNETGINDVVLSGGTFQNRYILERAEKSLNLKKFNVFTPSQIPANDGGIALGQLWVGANYLS